MAGLGMPAIDFQAKALDLYADRGRVLASNIANADTPGYQARDFNFQDALAAATGNAAAATGGPVAMTQTNPGHMSASGAAANGSAAGTPPLLYRVPTQPSMDGNTVDLDQERAEFAQNSVRYEATLRFLNSEIKQMTTVITG